MRGDYAIVLIVQVLCHTLPLIHNCGWRHFTLPTPQSQQSILNESQFHQFYWQFLTYDSVCSIQFSHAVQQAALSQSAASIQVWVSTNFCHVDKWRKNWYTSAQRNVNEALAYDYILFFLWVCKMSHRTLTQSRWIDCAQYQIAHIKRERMKNQRFFTLHCLTHGIIGMFSFPANQIYQNSKWNYARVAFYLPVYVWHSWEHGGAFYILILNRYFNLGCGYILHIQVHNSMQKVLK